MPCIPLPQVQPPPPKKKKTLQTCSLFEAVHLAVIEPAVDGKVIDVAFRGSDLHFGSKPQVVGEERGVLLVELDQDKLSDGLGAAHCEFRHLKGK